MPRDPINELGPNERAFVTYEISLRGGYSTGEYISIRKAVEVLSINGLIDQWDTMYIIIAYYGAYYDISPYKIKTYPLSEYCQSHRFLRGFILKMVEDSMVNWRQEGF
jgi:hypothetical protein